MTYSTSFASIMNPEGLLIVAILIIVLFGGQKIPELMRGVGRGIGELRKGMDEGRQHVENAIREVGEHSQSAAPEPQALEVRPPEEALGRLGRPGETDR